ncbi:MAG: DUF502 domain-containing protein [Gammaproteobacteria bacterium]|nr:DUF502 domain-containing protein [Gammaproteobacteria bacterium]MCW8840392.1 DUF502 domain-containing protein [Gammaproteobacteria bacterium]MCW8928119.1 DUF502 domain-containing protein [Gammaproteobacteria bacterium]MCW8957615.1 DUF502 domain-containing protein [Gammaproteobacteria bacterium]MCW8972986.1 DUF502 domain-containing protein [Gammaproteobacteria bacterium]
MQYLWKNMLRGLAAVLPITLTLYLIYWIAVYTEKLLHPVITLVVPERFYLPGLGVIAGLVVLFFIGLAVNAWVVQRLFRLVEALMERIPLVKSIYGSLHDFMSYFSAAEQRGGLKQVVMVSFGGARLIGFLTRERVEDIPGMQAGDEEIVAVYLPLSYQIGGYTLYLPRSQVEPINLSMEEAMRRVLTAELSKSTGNSKGLKG